MHISKSSTPYYFARNTPCTLSELSYIDKITRIVKNSEGADKNALLRSMVEAVVKSCVPKIRPMMGKLVKGLWLDSNGDVRKELKQRGRYERMWGVEDQCRDLFHLK